MIQNEDGKFDYLRKKFSLKISPENGKNLRNSSLFLYVKTFIFILKKNKNKKVFCICNVEKYREKWKNRLIFSFLQYFSCFSLDVSFL
jgi:hypothetical protein